MTRDELIEAMEAAILASDTCHATSALAAIEAAGYAVVPVEPSPAMVDAGGSVVSMGQIDPMHINDRWHGPEGWTMHEQEQGMLLQGRLSGSVRIYQAMLAASPLKQGEGE